MRILLLYRGENSQWSERFMNYLEEQTDGEAMINCIKNGDQPLPHVTQVSIAGTSSTEQPPLKDKSMWKALVLYEYETLKANKGELFLDTYIRYIQYATMMRQNNNLMDINIDALYNILKQNQGDVNDAIGLNKKTIVVTSDPLALIAEKTKVSKGKEKVVVSSDPKGSDANDFSELKKMTSLLAKAFNRRKFYSKPANNNSRTSSASQSASKKQEYVKSDDKKVEKKDDEKKRDMRKVKGYNFKKEGHFAKDCMKAKESSSDSDQEINANMVFMAQIEKVLSDSEASSSSADDKIFEVSYYLSESKSESKYETLKYYDNTTIYGLFVNDNDDQEIFHDCENFPENLIESQIDHNESAIDHNDSKGINKLIRKFNKKIAKCLKHIEKANQQKKDFKIQNKDFQDKYNVLKNQATTFEMKNKELNEQLKVLIEKNDNLLSQTNVLKDQLQVKHVVINTNVECQEKYAKLVAERYEYIIRYYAYFDNDKQHRKHIANQEDTLSSVRRPKPSGVMWMRKGSSNTIKADLSSVNHSNLIKNVKRYSCKNLMACNNSDTRSAFDCNNARNALCNARMNASNDVNNLFFLMIIVHTWLLKLQSLVEPIAKWIPRVTYCPNLSLDHRFRMFKAYDRKLKEKGNIKVFVGYSRESAAFRIYNKQTRKIHEIVNVNFDEILEMASKLFCLEPGLSNLNKTRKSSNPSVPQVSETSKKDLEDLFQYFNDEYFDSSKIMKSLTTNVETYNVKIPSNKEEVFHEKEVEIPSSNTQSVSNNMVPNVDDASISQNVVNECLEDAYFNTKDHPLHKIIGDPKSSVRIRGRLANSCLFSCLLNSIKPANVAEALRDADWVSAMQEELDQFARLKVWRLDFTVFQMDVKTAFLDRILKEEVYVGQPSNFVSKQYAYHVYALDKALYGLKQAPRAWYDVLLQLLIKSSLQKVPAPMVEHAKLKLNLVGKPVDHTDYRSMIGSLMCVMSSRPDIMFSTSELRVSISTAKSKYVAVSNYRAQVLLMRNQLTDNGFFYDKVLIYCDSKSAIAISCNSVQHTRTKHIDV
nr:hypothetical protein [Tanacetum cinerariifolium]